MTRPAFVRAAPPLRTLVVLGALAVIGVMAVDEYWDLPAKLFRDIETPLRHHEFLMESTAMLGVGVLVFGLLRRVLTRIEHLSSLLTMCSWCRRVAVDGEWMAIEQFLKHRGGAKAAMGLCPECYDARRLP